MDGLVLAVIVGSRIPPQPFKLPIMPAVGQNEGLTYLDDNGMCCK